MTTKTKITKTKNQTHIEPIEYCKLTTDIITQELNVFNSAIHGEVRIGDIYKLHINGTVYHHKIIGMALRTNNSKCAVSGNIHSKKYAMLTVEITIAKAWMPRYLDHTTKKPSWDIYNKMTKAGKKYQENAKNEYGKKLDTIDPTRLFSKPHYFTKVQ